MRTITTTEELASFCTKAAGGPYVTVDTEFLRERTYYSKLCLIQMALPGDGEAVLIDPIEGDLSLDPLFDLFRDERCVKVFHAARQDLEIFFFEGQVFPKPLFDTQLAAMVCGFGEQVGYETLVKKIARANIDKTSRFTDWSRRPLSKAQQNYALADVTHLRGIYEHLAGDIKKSGRQHWVEEELEVLLDPQTYIIEPEEAWRRVKTRTSSGRFLAIVKCLASFRENYAQNQNIPRGRVFKDDALLELASTKPKSLSDLGKSRLLLRDARKGPIADGIIEAVQKAMGMPPEDFPRADKSRENLAVNPALADLLRVLLKSKSEMSGVAQKLIATAHDLDTIAAGERSAAALRGWRKEVFGNDAIRLCDGEIALAAKGSQVTVIPV
ncbi:MAG: ribonuclease D [Pseudomonadota bacterium]